MPEQWFYIAVNHSSDETFFDELVNKFKAILYANYALHMGGNGNTFNPVRWLMGLWYTHYYQLLDIGGCSNPTTGQKLTNLEVANDSASNKIWSPDYNTSTNFVNQA